MAKDSHPGPHIFESFDGYEASFPVEKLIRDILREVPPRFLAGLHSIVVTNVEALSRRERRKKGSREQNRARVEEALGYYTQAWKGEPASITLLLDRIEEQWTGVWWRIGFIRAMTVSHTLLHEIGHHIHKAHRPEYANKESVADRWSDKLSKKFMVRRYWYLILLVAPILLIYGLCQDIARLFRKIRVKHKKS